MNTKRNILLGILFLTISFCAFSAGIKAVEAKTKILKKAIIKDINKDTKVIKAIKEGDTYTIYASSAKYRKGATSSNSMKFSTIKEGDVITVEGSFDGKKVTATKIRDLSYYDKKTVTFYGTIDSTNATTSTLKINTIDRDDQAVSILSSTKIKNENGKKIKLADLKEDDRVLVKGKWSRKKNTITKTQTIDILNDDDYSDLDD
ncbi:MAG: DUF5666 domain-containing protein [Parcubacteria group bacterium]|jgi:hypothetical protein